MLTKFHKILLGLLVVQLALAVVTSLRSGHAAPVKEQPLLAKFDAGKVTRLQIAGGTATTPIDLVKKDGGWVLASQFGYPADATKVADALSALGRMQAGEPIATSSGHHRQLKVDDAEYERKLTVTADGKDLVVYVGGPSGSRRTAVRLDGPKVWAVSGVTAYTYATDARSWVDPSYVKVPRDEVARITVDQGGVKKVELEKNAAPPPPAAQPGEPAPPPPPATFAVKLDGAPIALATGETMDSAAIDRLVDHATTISLEAPADPSKAATPTATITIERTGATSTPAPTVIDVVADADGYWVKERGSSKAARVGKSSLDDLLEATRATVVKAPTPPPAPGAAPPPAPEGLPPGFDPSMLQGQ